MKTEPLDVKIEIFSAALASYPSIPCHHGLLGFLGLKKTCGICGGRKLLEEILEELKARRLAQRRTKW